MKFQLYALLLVVAGACAMPQAADVVVDSLNQPTPRVIVENQIRRVIQQISNGIRDAGLDPLEIVNEEFVFTPIPFLIEFTTVIESLTFVGASNIRIHSLDYSIVLNRLRFDISLPELSLSVSDSAIMGSILGTNFEGEVKGSLVIESIRLSGEARVNVGIISGISLRSISLNFRVSSIRSDLQLWIGETEYSDFLNNVFNEVIPNALEDNREEINERLENLVRQIFNLIS